MFKYLRKHKLLSDILFTIVLAVASFAHWDDYGEKGKQMNLLGGILFGIMAIIKLSDVIDGLRKRKNPS